MPDLATRARTLLDLHTVRHPVGQDDGPQPEDVGGQLRGEGLPAGRTSHRLTAALTTPPPG